MVSALNKNSQRGSLQFSSASIRANRTGEPVSVWPSVKRSWRTTSVSLKQPANWEGGLLSGSYCRPDPAAEAIHCTRVIFSVRISSLDIHQVDHQVKRVHRRGVVQFQRLNNVARDAQLLRRLLVNFFFGRCDHKNFEVFPHIARPEGS
jgi:hypothetical protein